MSIVEDINHWLKEYDFQGEEANEFVGLLVKARDELVKLEADGVTLLNVINDKNHNASIMRREIASLKAKLSAAKKN